MFYYILAFNDLKKKNSTVSKIVTQNGWVAELVNPIFKHEICCWTWPPVESTMASYTFKWAESSEFVSSSIPSWQILTAHAQPFRGARDLAFRLKVLLDSLLVWASSEGSGDKHQIRLARPKCSSISFLLEKATETDASAWYADGRGFDPHVRQYPFVEIGHEIISTAILALPLIQKGQLLAEECALSMDKLPRRLAQEQCG